MVQWRCFDGSEHPVSERFSGIAPADLNGASFERVEGERQFLLASGMRLVEGKPIFFPKELSKKQRARLRGIDHIINVNRALQFLDGRDYRSPNDLFGVDGTLCQVHGNLWKPDTCGCELSFIFDHWLRERPKEIVHYPHHFRVLACARHRGFSDFRDHFHAVLEENQAKNRGVASPSLLRN
jgi:hypothetical protein